MGRDAPENDGPGAYHEVAEPVHLGSGVIQRRDAQKVVGMGLVVMAVFQKTGKLQIPVGKKRAFRSARCAGGKVQARRVAQADVHGRIGPGAFIQDAVVCFGIVRTHFTGTREEVVGDAFIQLRLDLSDPFHELLAQDEGFCLCNLGARVDVVRREPIVERNHPCAGAQNAEIRRQPIDAVCHQVDDPVAFFYVPTFQGIGYGIGLIVKLPPCQFGSFVFSGRPLDEGDVVSIHPSVSRQDFGDQHVQRPFCKKANQGSAPGSPVIIQTDFPS